MLLLLWIQLERRILGPIATVETPMNPLGPFAFVATAVVLWAMPGASQAQWQGGYAPGTRFTCDSNDGRYRECRVDVQQGVQLVRQTSRSQCIEGQSWGVNRNGV